MRPTEQFEFETPVLTHKTARRCKTPMKCSIVNLVLRNKQSYRVATVQS